MTNCPAVPKRDVRCPECGRLLFRASGDGTVIEIKCKCSRVVKVT